MEGGAARKENLIALYTYAGQQAAAGRGGLFDFVTQLHDLLEEGRQPPITTRTAGSGVQIMSVHRSKGLEFPVVILTDLHKTFNADDFRRPVLVTPGWAWAPSGWTGKSASGTTPSPKQPWRRP